MKIVGKEKFLKQLGAFPAAMRDEVRKALEVSAEEATDLMRRFVPVEKGVLLSTIGYRFGEAPSEAGFIADESAAGLARAAKGEAGLAVTMFAGGHATTKQVREGAGEEAFDYALAAEFGTLRQPARPFFWPAYRLARKRAKARLARALRNGAKKAIAS